MATGRLAANPDWKVVAAHEAVPGGFTREVTPDADRCFYRVRQE